MYQIRPSIPNPPHTTSSNLSPSIHHANLPPIFHIRLARQGRNDVKEGTTEGKRIPKKEEGKEGMKGGSHEGKEGREEGGKVVKGGRKEVKEGS
jgi:hypothetical protein